MASRHVSSAQMPIWLYAAWLIALMATFGALFIGGAIALWHSLLYAGIIKEAIVPCARSGPSCTDSAMLTVANLPIPYLSFISFVAIAILLILFHNKSSKVSI